MKPTVYQALVATGVEIYNHYSDLYVEDTPEVRAILAQYPEQTASTFRDHMGKVCFDIPFAYDPYWQLRYMTKAERFFFDHAAYSYGVGESPEEGKLRCAEELAAAERWARAEGYHFSWEVDCEVDSHEFDDSDPPWSLWVCTMYGPDGGVVASLCAIDFGQDGEPWGHPYKREVEAELARDVQPIDICAGCGRPLTPGCTGETTQ